MSYLYSLADVRRLFMKSKIYKGVEFKQREITLYMVAKEVYNASFTYVHDFTIEVRKNAYNKYDGNIFGKPFKYNHEISFCAIDTFEECVDLLLEDLVGYFNKKAEKATEFAKELQ